MASVSPSVLESSHLATRTRRVRTIVRGLGLAFVVSLAASPGLLGSWVYDDLWMLGNPTYDDLGDIPASFERTSTDYLASSEPSEPGGGTKAGGAYRPMTMVTLVATHVLFPMPIVHHAVGLLLHVAVVFVLWGAIRRGLAGRDMRDRAAWVLASLVALHPVGVEAYVWINGRSDVVAGLFLVSLATVLASKPPMGGGTRRARDAATALLVLGGGLSKETFLPAAGALVLATIVDRDATGSRIRTSVSSLFGVALVFAARVAVGASSGGGFASGRDILSDPHFWGFLPRYAATASGAILGLRGSVMDSLAWLTVRPIPTTDWMALGLVVVGFLGLLRARDFRGAILVFGAFATLAPTAVVSRALWFGFDRYLYLPFLLGCLAAAPHLERLLAASPPRMRPILGAALAVVLLAGAMQTFSSSLAYRSQVALVRAMAEERPNDPTLLVDRACPSHGRVDPDISQRLLRTIPSEPWPDAILVPLIECATRLGRHDLVARAVAAGLRSHPDDPQLRTYAMQVRYRAGRIDEALALASTLGRSPFCSEVRRQLLIWERSASDPIVAARLRETSTNLECE